MLELRKMIGVSHVYVVACPIIFHSLYERGWQGGVLKVMKNDHFLVFLTVWVLSPNLTGRLSGGLC